MNIIGISGSLREESYNTKLLKNAKMLFPDYIAFEIVSVNDIILYNQDMDGEKKPVAVAKLLMKIANASAILFATPEFNHSMSGVLKNAIDWASRPAFNSPLLNKPCGILTAAMSPVGGARAQIDLKNVLSSTLSIVYPAVDYLLPNAHEKFDDAGNINDTIALNRLRNYVEGLVTWTEKINKAVK